MNEIMDDYDAGFLAGRKKAYELVGELAEFYRDNIDCGLIGRKMRRSLLRKSFRLK